MVGGSIPPCPIMPGNMYQEIADFIYAGKNHERKKSVVRKKFGINGSTFQWVLIYMTHKFLIYENDTGRKIGILEKWFLLFVYILIIRVLYH